MKNKILLSLVFALIIFLQIDFNGLECALVYKYKTSLENAIHDLRIYQSITFVVLVLLVYLSLLIIQKMKKTIFLILILLISIYSFKLGNDELTKYPTNEFEIKWVKELKSDFSFKKNWSYPEGIYRNQFGQLSCDGICPDKIDEMKDENGMIKDQFIEQFYQIVDTTHLFYTFDSETDAPEFGESNFINIKGNVEGKIEIESESNLSTHSSLKIEIKDSKFSAQIDFGSITPIGNHEFPLNKGILKIEQESWEKGIIKAEFDFKFKDTFSKKGEIYWKGKIIKRIEK